MLALPYLPDPAAPGFACVASAANGGCLEVFALRGDSWQPVQRVATPAPGFLLLSSDRRTLYVANQVDEHLRLPRGTVEAYRVDPVEGRLSLLERRPLSLAATQPRHMALSADGKLLAVAAHGGGMYNVLPVADNGSLGEPAAIFKDVGAGAHPQLQTTAHPHSVIFDPARRLLATDFGADRLSLFEIENSRLVRRSKQTTEEGSGPGDCVLSSSALYVWRHLDHTLDVYSYPGTLGPVLQRLPLSASPVQALALHPQGGMLYTAHPGKLTAWRIAPDGKLVHSEDRPLPGGPFTQILVASAAPGQAESIYLLGSSIYRLRAGRATSVARVESPTSMVLAT